MNELGEKDFGDYLDSAEDSLRKQRLAYGDILAKGEEVYETSGVQFGLGIKSGKKVLVCLPSDREREPDSTKEEGWRLMLEEDESMLNERSRLEDFRSFYAAMHSAQLYSLEGIGISVRKYYPSDLSEIGHMSMISLVNRGMVCVNSRD